MLRFMLNNQKLLNRIASKLFTKCLRKNFGCKSAKITVKDIVVDDGIVHDNFTIHLNADISISKTELLELLDSKIEESD